MKRERRGEVQRNARPGGAAWAGSSARGRAGCSRSAPSCDLGPPCGARCPRWGARRPAHV